jgi:polysaccharide chain length determinant protein (PEP-CTERM system associated)
MDDYQLTLTDYVAILRRRAWLIVGSFFGTLVLGIAVALLLPSVYRATGTILIESQQIPVDLVQASVTSYADERIEVIKQRVMTRENLLRIIRKYNLFADAGPTFTPSEQIDEMRKTIAVDLVNANIRSDRRGSATIAFQLSFEHKRAEVAQAVANDLVTLFLDENVKVRTERASQTTEFLTQEADKLKKDLDALEAQIAAFKQEHGKTLPENVALGLAAMQRAEADLRQVERDYAAAEESLRAVEAERGAAQSQSSDGAGNLAELQRARAEVTRLSATYTEDHPDLRAARRRVESLEQAGAENSDASPAVADAALRRIDARATALRDRLKVLAAQRGALRGRIGQMDTQLVRSPQVERGLTALTRDYQSAQKKYEEILAKKMTAQVAENLEGDQKAERFAVLEPPTLPDRPIKPDRKKLIALSLLLAMAAPVGAVALMEALHGTVRGVGQISAIVGQKPLVTVPLIPVAAELASRKRVVLMLAGGGVLATCVALAIVHFLVLPLDILLVKAIVRLG